MKSRGKMYEISFPPEGREGAALIYHDARADGLSCLSAVVRVLESGHPPEGFRIVIESGSGDIENGLVVVCPFSLLIVSAEIADALRAIRCLGAEFVKVPLVADNGEVVRREFFLVWIQKICDPLSEKSKIIKTGDGSTEIVFKAVLSRSKIPADVEMFRIREAGGKMVCSSSVRMALKPAIGNGLSVKSIEIDEGHLGAPIGARGQQAKG